MYLLEKCEAKEVENDNGKITITTIEFSHENKKVFFDLNEESDGTARLLDLIEILFKVSDDRVFIIDEIDRCLHPSMTVKVIELFLSMAKKRNTQLIITSHESRLLASEMLRNDEICFVYKTAQGKSIINPLEKYQLRADKKVYAALFDGTLDAGPSFDEANYPDYLNSIEKCEVEKRHLTFFVCVYSWPTISRYTVSGTYHTATISRHARTKPPITPPIMKFNANKAIPPPREPPPGTIQRHIRWRPNGSPQSIQSHT